MTTTDSDDAYHHSLCVECGPDVRVDEDGLCAGCGATAVGNWLEEHAHLISAAPEMLAALRELVDLVESMRAGTYDPDSFTTQPARAAIRKAEGEP